MIDSRLCRLVRRAWLSWLAACCLWPLVCVAETRAETSAETRAETRAETSAETSAETAAEAAESERLALLAINAGYRELAPLATGATATLLHEALERTGFRVELLRDPSSGVLLAALRRLQAQPDGVDTALVYFVGYARQLRDKNFLIPANADPKSAFDLLTQGVDLDSLRDAVATAARRLGLVIIDGAYPEPRLDAIAELKPGLAPAPSTGATLTLLSAPPGRVLAPGASPETLARAFAEALDASLAEPSTTIDTLVTAFSARAARDGGRELARFAGADLPARLGPELQAASEDLQPEAEQPAGDPIDPTPGAERAGAEMAGVTRDVDFEASLSETQRRDVQRALRQIGLYRAGIDGQFGPLTRDAIRIFQRSRGLPATGQLDADLLGVLFDLMEPGS